jgi:hypothetical protein
MHGCIERGQTHLRSVRNALRVHLRGFEMERRSRLMRGCWSGEGVERGGRVRRRSSALLRFFCCLVSVDLREGEREVKGRRKRGGKGRKREVTFLLSLQGAPPRTFEALCDDAVTRQKAGSVKGTMRRKKTGKKTGFFLPSSLAASRQAQDGSPTRFRSGRASYTAPGSSIPSLFSLCFSPSSFGKASPAAHLFRTTLLQHHQRRRTEHTLQHGADAFRRVLLLQLAPPTGAGEGGNKGRRGAC